MRWLDVAGPPGSGKSTLCDGDFPRKLPLDNKPYPVEWHEFIECAYHLIRKIENNPDECWLIFDSYARKTATIQRKEDPGAYVNTALAQAGLDIGWRGVSPEGYFKLMPVSIGVVFLTADIEILRQRNVDRGLDRSYQIEGMERTRLIATEVLESRGVAVLTLNTEAEPSVNRKILSEAAR